MKGIPNHTEHGLFADDTALWTSSNRASQLTVRLQESTDEFQRWCNAWKLKLQPTKTEMIHFSPHPRKKYKHPVMIRIEQSTIQPQESTRYLGVIIDKKLTWRNHLQQIEPKCAHRIHLLRFLSRSAKNPDPKIMFNIYKTIVRPILAYGFPLLLTASEKTWDSIKNHTEQGYSSSTELTTVYVSCIDTSNQQHSSHQTIRRIIANQSNSHCTQ